MALTAIGLSKQNPCHGEVPLHIINSGTQNERTATPGEVQNDGSIDLIGKEKEEEESDYITGIALGLVVFGVTCVVFLIMLDSTIVVTVSPRTAVPDNEH